MTLGETSFVVFSILCRETTFASLHVFFLLQVKFEAQKNILQSLESYLQVLHGVSGTVAAPQSEGLRCLLHPIIPSVSPYLPFSYLLWTRNDISNIHWALAGVR